MPQMTVHLLGIMYFNVCKAQPCDPASRQVLLPDGTLGRGHIPPHYASIFVEDARLGGITPNEDAWPGHILQRTVSIHNRKKEHVDVLLHEFRITDPNTLVTFPDGNSGIIENVNLDRGLIPLSEVAPSFKPDLTGKGSIARLQIGGGSLCAFSFNGVSPVQWTMDSGNQPLEITATSATRSATLLIKPQPNSTIGTEIVVSNAPDLLSDAVNANAARGLTNGSHSLHGHGDEPHHFTLYDKINNGPTGKLKLPEERSMLRAGHAYIKALGDFGIQNSCTGTCCAH